MHSGTNLSEYSDKLREYSAKFRGATGGDCVFLLLKNSKI
jgi:mevalonate kinase